MLKMYCQKCGCAHEYAVEKPNFCQKCGSPFHALAGKEVSQDELNEGDALEKVPNLKGLDIDIELPQKRTVTLGDIAGTNEHGTDVKLSDNVKDPRTAQEILKEASTLKKQNE
jgi:hypothetical protein